MSDSQQRLPLDDPRGRGMFRGRLLGWYDRNQRDLPWRASRDPYRVWLAEIMLQQTRVAVVVEYYKRFLKRFPTVEDLAAARQSSVLAAWSGLGYYRRARMAHETAKKIVKKYGGRFPTSAAELRRLPGIGRYTAAAIASIAFGEAVAVVDGNIERVVRRVLGEDLSGERVWQAAEELLSRQRPGDSNQAMMELGATICLPQRPNCLVCPVFEMCATRGEAGEPVKEVRRKKEIRYALDCRDGSVLLVQRPKSASLMPGMWELPEIKNGTGSGKTWLKLRHSITVTDYMVRVSQGPAPRGAEGRWVRKSGLSSLPLTGLARKILRAAKII